MRMSRANLDRGAVVYKENCAVCHMEDGSGAGAMNPPVKGSQTLSGPPFRLVRLLLQGPDAVLPPDRTRYGSAMPTFESLSDEDVAAVVNYVRAEFGRSGVGGRGGRVIQPARVKMMRNAGTRPPPPSQP
jgi:nitrite reductase (NO-forming)